MVSNHCHDVADLNFHVKRSNMMLQGLYRTENNSTRTPFYYPCLFMDIFTDSVPQLLLNVRSFVPSSLCHHPFLLHSVVYPVVFALVHPQALSHLKANFNDGLINRSLKKAISKFSKSIKLPVRKYFWISIKEPDGFNIIISLENCQTSHSFFGQANSLLRHFCLCIECRLSLRCHGFLFRAVLFITVVFKSYIVETLVYFSFLKFLMFAFKIFGHKKILSLCVLVVFPVESFAKAIYFQWIWEMKLGMLLNEVE